MVTKKNINQAIEKVVNLPSQFYNLENISIYSLLEETGYFEIPDKINEENILVELVNHPECIEQWLDWSENKRVTSGWYFRKSKNGKYIVGYFPEKETIKSIESSYASELCAKFIKREIEDIRKE